MHSPKMSCGGVSHGNPRATLQHGMLVVKARHRVIVVYGMGLEALERRERGDAVLPYVA